MSMRHRRYLTLLLLAAGVMVLTVIPGMGDAQEATPGAQPAAPEVITRGEEIYATTCIACHQAGGEGVTDVAIGGFPALNGNPFVTLEDPAPMVQTILNGRAGMPNFRSFSDEDIAAVASYVRQAWENEAGPVDPALVAEIRAQFEAEGLPAATPIATEWPGSLATPGSGGAMEGGDTEGTEGSPEAEGGATSGGVTPIPTIGQ